MRFCGKERKCSAKTFRVTYAYDLQGLATEADLGRIPAFDLRPQSEKSHVLPITYTGKSKVVIVCDTFARRQIERASYRLSIRCLSDLVHTLYMAASFNTSW